MKTNDSGVPFLSGTRTSTAAFKKNYENIFKKDEKTFGQRIKEYRTEHGLTQHSMGYRLGCHKVHICHLEKEYSPGSAEIQERFEELLIKGEK